MRNEIFGASMRVTFAAGGVFGAKAFRIRINLPAMISAQKVTVLHQSRRESLDWICEGLVCSDVNESTTAVHDQTVKGAEHFCSMLLLCRMDPTHLHGRINDQAPT